MKKKNFDHLACPVAATLSVIGDHWSMLVVRDLFFGLDRFDELQADLGIARNILTDRLRKLTDEGIVERVTDVEEGERGRPRYRLTDQGQALRPVLLEMARWGERHRPDKSGDGSWRDINKRRPRTEATKNES